jgi:hypothetical protein
LFKGLSIGSNEIDEFVTVRGSIAHRGREAEYIRIQDLSERYKIDIEKVAIEIDNKVSDYIRDNTDGKKPWNITQ